jgi:hypothetical protein
MLCALWPSSGEFFLFAKMTVITFLSSPPRRQMAYVIMLCVNASGTGRGGRKSITRRRQKEFNNFKRILWLCGLIIFIPDSLFAVSRQILMNRLSFTSYAKVVNGQRRRKRASRAVVESARLGMSDSNCRHYSFTAYLPFFDCFK